MKLLAIDRELEHYLRVIAPNYNNPSQVDVAEKWLDKLMNRYNLFDDDGYLDGKLEAILQAQIKAEVIYNSQ